LIGVITFVSAIYLWLMSIFYVPGPVIVLLTALMTGLFLSVYVANNLSRTFTLNVIENKHYGFVLIALVLAVVISTITLVLKVSEQYLSQVSYVKSLLSANSSSLAEFDENLQASEYLFAQDIFTAERARLRLVELNRLVALAEPTDLDRQVFQNNLIEGITLSEKAITLDPTNPFNHALLASFYGLLNVEQTPEVKSRRDNELAQVKLLDPKNPSYLVLFAQLSAKQGDLVTARSHLNEALNLKNDYTDALLLLSQIDLEEGKIESAIKVTNSIIALEPNNPARYFQLGVLLAKNNNLDQSVIAFKEAIRLDNSYANARYFLALTYLDLNKKEEALIELKNVLITNPDNQEIKNLISRVESGEFTKVDSSLAVPVDDVSVVDKKENVTTATETPDTDLVTPLNQNNNAPQIEDKSKTESISVDADTVTE
jgi:tetratricopeptide (TPR) repeat protein